MKKYYVEAQGKAADDADYETVYLCYDDYGYYWSNDKIVLLSEQVSELTDLNELYIEGYQVLDGTIKIKEFN